jgi:NitT/TauT family transport system substrate-binding protein
MIRTGYSRKVGLASATLFAGALLFQAVPAASQNLTKVRYAEVVRSVFYLPKYIALAKGYFKDEGLDVEMTTTWGGDKGTAQLLGGRVDIVLQGPETAVYIENGASPEKTKMFASLTATDGLFLVSRKKIEMADFKWSMIRGKEVLGWRPGSTPGLFLEHAMKKHGIDPTRNVTHTTNLAIPARFGAWMSGKGDFAVFFEPDISRLEMEGKAYPVVSIGKEAGLIDYTVFMATDSYIRKNPKVIQSFTNAIYRAQKWVATGDARETATLVGKWFPRVPAAQIERAVNRYRAFGIWKTDPSATPAAIEALQDILIEGGVLKADKRVKFDSIVTNRFAEEAKRTVR